MPLKLNKVFVFSEDKSKIGISFPLEVIIFLLNCHHVITMTIAIVPVKTVYLH